VNHFPRILVEERFSCGNVDDGKLNTTNVGTGYGDILYCVDSANTFDES
jgi:hypothetical protein